MTTIETCCAELDDRLGHRTGYPWPAPEYAATGFGNERLLLGVESMARHMTDEGQQLQDGLAGAGYQLWGHGYQNNITDVCKIFNKQSKEMTRFDTWSYPLTVIVQDKREWDPTQGGCFVSQAEFRNTHDLVRPDIFRVTVLKDAHADPEFYQQAHREIGCHAWITYYHPGIVSHLCPWTRPEHYARTWHSVDRAAIPTEEVPRRGCLLSGARNEFYYPVREMLFRGVCGLPETRYVLHPGYGATGAHTPRFLEHLRHYKVALCTVSVLGYALRKLIEATACGCVVVTNLPEWERLPEIDDNMVRVPSDATLEQWADAARDALANYNLDRQRELAARAIDFYDYRRRGGELAAAIEQIRSRYV